MQEKISWLSAIIVSAIVGASVYGLGELYLIALSR